MKTRSLILAALMAVLTALGSMIRIPMPVSSFTLQIFFCAMSGFLLGSRWGAVSQIGYLLLGVIGLPVFASGVGFGAFLTPTGGFLLALVPMAWICGKFQKGYLALGVLYMIGLPYMHLIITLYLQKPWSVWQTVLYGMLIFLPFDLIKIYLASWLCKKIRPRLL